MSAFKITLVCFDPVDIIWTGADLLWRHRERFLQRVSPIISLPQTLSFIALDRFNGPHMFWLEPIQSKLTWSDSSNRWLIKTISRFTFELRLEYYNRKQIWTWYGSATMKGEWSDISQRKHFLFCLLPALAKKPDQDIKANKHRLGQKYAIFLIETFRKM